VCAIVFARSAPPFEPKSSFTLNAEPREHDLQRAKEAQPVEREVHPTGGDAIVRLVRAGVVTRVVLRREEEARALQRAPEARRPLLVSPLVDLRVAVATQEHAEHQRERPRAVHEGVGSTRRPKEQVCPATRHSLLAAKRPFVACFSAGSAARCFRRKTACGSVCKP
jgi:hypothetical protein